MLGVGRAGLRRRGVPIPGEAHSLQGDQWGWGETLKDSENQGNAASVSPTHSGPGEPARVLSPTPTPQALSLGPAPSLHHTLMPRPFLVLFFFFFFFLLLWFCFTFQLFFHLYFPNISVSFIILVFILCYCSAPFFFWPHCVACRNFGS